MMRGLSRSRVFGFGIVWLSLGVMAYLGFHAFLSPRVARPVAHSGEPVVIERSHDQHFYVEGAINGHPVTFLVDTGASLVSIGETTASAIGLSAGVPAVFNTAAGPASGRIVADVRVTVGGLRVDGLRVGVGSVEQALLGQNFLKRFRLTQDGDRLVLRASDF